jgi:hypothetical protein
MISEIWINQRALVISSVIFLLATVVFAIITQFDLTQILGINRWIKPIKFSLSAAIFLFTVAVYLYYLQGFEQSKTIIGWGTIIIMFIEVALIVMQAARGTTSHFNVSNAFDGAVFSAMGLMIFTNTLLIVWLGYLYFVSDFDLPNAVVWGMRLGIIIFLLGSIQGGYMASQTGHSVGVADGGSGLPFLSWSTVGGDLRIAHFFGLHAFQIIPLFAVLLTMFSISYSTAMTFGFGLIYFVGFTSIFVQALNGQPILRSFGN